MEHRTVTGILRAYDYSRPSYKIYKEELLAALGQPTRLHSEGYESVEYEVLTDGKMHWYLAIECRNGYVVESTVHGELEDKK